MDIYEDMKNKSGMKVLFMLLHMFMLIVVYTIVYTSFLAVDLAVKHENTSKASYLFVFVVLIGFPVLLYRYRQMFNAGKMLGATIWTVASSSFIIVLLYVYVAQITD